MSNLKLFDSVIIGRGRDFHLITFDDEGGGGSKIGLNIDDVICGDHGAISTNPFASSWRKKDAAVDRTLWCWSRASLRYPSRSLASESTHQTFLWRPNSRPTHFFQTTLSYYNLFILMTLSRVRTPLRVFLWHWFNRTAIFSKQWTLNDGENIFRLNSSGNVSIKQLSISIEKRIRIGSMTGQAERKKILIVKSRRFDKKIPYSQ